MCEAEAQLLGYAIELRTSWTTVAVCRALGMALSEAVTERLAAGRAAQRLATRASRGFYGGSPPGMKLASLAPRSASSSQSATAEQEAEAEVEAKAKAEAKVEAEVKAKAKADARADAEIIAEVAAWEAAERASLRKGVEAAEHQAAKRAAKEWIAAQMKLELRAQASLPKASSGQTAKERTDVGGNPSKRSAGGVEAAAREGGERPEPSARERRQEMRRKQGYDAAAPPEGRKAAAPPLEGRKAPREIATSREARGGAVIASQAASPKKSVASPPNKSARQRGRIHVASAAAGSARAQPTAQQTMQPPRDRELVDLARWVDVADDQSVWSVVCPRPLIVRSGSRLDSGQLTELAPGEEVTIVKTAHAGSSQRALVRRHPTEDIIGGIRARRDPNALPSGSSPRDQTT